MKLTKGATAVALAMAALSAHAQSSVTMYGQGDLGVQYEKASNGNTSRLVSGGRSASRLGFRGIEDLGGGMNAIFTIEMGLNMDTGTFGQGGRPFGRQAFVGLSGPWGTVAAGRVATFGAGTGYFDMLGDIDPFSTAWGIAGMGATMSTATGLRLDNTVVYRTPEFGGFQGGLLHSFQAVGGEVTPRNGNIYVTGAGARYTAGPFHAAVTYESANNPAPGAKNETHLQLGAVYKLKPVWLHASYAREIGLFSTDLNISGTKNGAGAKAYMVGLSVPVGSGIIRTSYQKRDGESLGGEKRDVRVMALGYEHFLSKRTSLYAAIADSDGKNTLNNNPAYDRRTVTAGVLHKF